MARKLEDEDPLSDEGSSIQEAMGRRKGNLNRREYVQLSVGAAAAALAVGGGFALGVTADESPETFTTDFSGYVE